LLNGLLDKRVWGLLHQLHHHTFHATTTVVAFQDALVGGVECHKQSLVVSRNIGAFASCGTRTNEKEREGTRRNENEQTNETSTSPPPSTTNNQQPTTNYQLPTTNNQQPTTNNQQPTTNNQQPTTNNQQPTTNQWTDNSPIIDHHHHHHQGIMA
jgi:hypothetical protein